MSQRLQHRVAPMATAALVVAALGASLAPHAGLAASKTLPVGPVQTAGIAHGSGAAARTASPTASSGRPLPRHSGPRTANTPIKVASTTATSSASAPGFHLVNVDTASTGAAKVSSGGNLSVEQLAGYQGFSRDLQEAQYHHGGTPPDTQIATNGSLVIEAVNTSLYLMQHDGSNAFTEDLRTLWAPAETQAMGKHPLVGAAYEISDPRIFFDPESGRWYMSIVIYDDALTNTATAAAAYSYIGLAASTDGNANAWNEMVMPGQAAQLLDQPGLGQSSDKLLSSSDDFDMTQVNNSVGGFVGGQIWIANKADLETNTAVVHFQSTLPDFNAFGYAPAVAHATGVNTGYVAWNDSPFLAVNTVTGKPSATTSATVAQQGLNMNGSTSLPPPIAQPGTSATLDSGNDRIENAVWQNNRLWVGANTGIQLTGLPPQSALLVAEVDTSQAVYTLADNTPAVLFTNTGTSLVYPEIALDGNGHPVIAMSRGSSSLYMSGGAFGLDPSQGTLYVADILRGASGTGYYDCTSECGGGPSRWGDYSGAAFDPSDPSNVWVATEYSATNPAAHNVLNWGTLMARVTLSAPTATGISVSSGRTTGGTVVTITGSNFDPVSSGALFGGVASQSVQWLDEHHIVAVAPPHAAGLAGVAATSADGISNSVGPFNYVEPPARSGYWLVAGDGGLFAFNAPYKGSTGNLHLNQPIVGMAAAPSGNGYWLVASDGGIFAFNAPYKGSTGAIHLNQPIVGMAATPSGNGYWLVASDGGIFAFGDAQFHGSTGAIHLKQPIVGMAPTSDGNGYWLVASDGGIFAFGDAAFHGSTGNIHLNQPVVGMAPTTAGGGYWLVASDGGIFAFGDAAYHGSTGAIHLNQPIVGMAQSGDDGGYWLVARDGGIFAFGAAAYEGSTGAIHLNQPIVGMATVPS